MNKKSRDEKGFSAVEIMLAVIAVVILSVAGMLVYKDHHNLSNSTSNTGSSEVFIKLDDSGSTNTPPWILTVNKDGGGSLTNNTFPNGRGVSNGNKTFKAATFSIVALRNKLSSLNVNNLPQCTGGQYPPASEAFGSASFGSTVSLIYKGKTIDNFCQNNATETTISQLLQAIITKADP